MLRTVLTSFALLTVVATASALAESHKIVTLRQPDEKFVGVNENISKILFLNRCKGGCAISPGVNDARNNTSTIAVAPTTITEFNGDDEEWGKIVQCVKEMYSPYNVTVTDVDPGPNGMFHSEAIVAGRDKELNPDLEAGGVAPGRSTPCAPANNVINFTFSNMVPKTAGRYLYICGVVGQESAHAFGLDHELDCSSPMTYLDYCGQTFFRNKNTGCHDMMLRPADCYCGKKTQNSHIHLLDIFGPGTPLTGNPVSKINQPASSATVTKNFFVSADASDRRGISRAELWLNGYKWLTYEEKKNPAEQTGKVALRAPDGVPDGVIDIQVKVFNDIEMSTTSQTITVTKGAPCSTEATCAVGQKCSAGKCFWEPASVDLGGACEFDQACLSGACLESDTGKVCSKSCFVGVADTCPADFDCVQAAAGGFCFPTAPEETGCCSVDGSGSSGAFVNGLLGLGLFGLVARRRRKN